MFQFPMHFPGKVVAQSGSQATWTAVSDGRKVVCAVPKEFSGPGGGLSPEDLFAQALMNCFTATFLVMAEKSQLKFKQVTVEGSLTVDRNETKRPVMKAMHMLITFVGCEAPDRASHLAKKALESGFILNSVKTELSHEIRFAEKEAPLFDATQASA